VLCSAGVAPVGAVDDARLRAASNATTDWLTYGHNYDNQRFSTLQQINRNNVARLAPRWIYQTGISATFLTSPMVADGVMYLSTPNNDVVALGAAKARTVAGMRISLPDSRQKTA
jgi:glucose dehydrogenase